MSKEALELKEKILQEKATLGQLDNQYKKTTMEANDLHLNKNINCFNV